MVHSSSFLYLSCPISNPPKWHFRMVSVIFLKIIIYYVKALLHPQKLYIIVSSRRDTRSPFPWGRPGFSDLVLTNRTLKKTVAFGGEFSGGSICGFSREWRLLQIWKDGLVGKSTFCESKKTRVQISSTHVKSRYGCKCLCSSHWGTETGSFENFPASQPRYRFSERLVSKNKVKSYGCTCVPTDIHLQTCIYLLHTHKSFVVYID